MDQIVPGQAAVVTFTAGTTGQPKAVVLSHHNILWTAQELARLLHAGEADSLISFLPLSHICEQMLTIYLPLLTRLRVYFVPSIALLTKTMREVQPSLLFATPEFWRKMYISLKVLPASPLFAYSCSYSFPTWLCRQNWELLFPMPTACNRCGTFLAVVVCASLPQDTATLQM